MTISHPASKVWIRWSLWWACQQWQNEESLLHAQQYIIAHTASRFLQFTACWSSTFPCKSSKYFMVKVKLGGKWIQSLLLTPFYLWINWVCRKKDIPSVWAPSWRRERKTSCTLLSQLECRKPWQMVPNKFISVQKVPVFWLFCAHKNGTVLLAHMNAQKWFVGQSLSVGIKCFLLSLSASQKSQESARM